MISGASKINKIYLFWNLPPLFSRKNVRTFFGRALSRSHMAFFRPFYYLSGCVLEETHGTAYLEVLREMLMEGQEP